jgi:hypothetical protein
VHFTRFPLEAGSNDLDRLLGSDVDAHRMALVTLEPQGGLATVTPAAVDALGAYLAEWNSRGLRILVRFGHEMNGSWYPWGQQPGAYVEAFRLVAAGVHQQAPGSAMLWAPNYGGGYPFPVGAFKVQSGSPDFAALDTDGNGQVDAQDDPYRPYYPGDDAVDWVGMSIYHWGAAYPWGENEVPEPGKFAAQLTGDYQGANGDDRAVPDFYADYADGHGKPLAITETGALFNPGQGGAAERAIKQAWWQQLFAADIGDRFPRLTLVDWFDWRKDEAEVGGVIDWRVSGDPAVATAFRESLPVSTWFAAAVDTRPCP